MKRALTKSELLGYLQPLGKDDLQEMICQLYNDSELSSKILDVRFASQEVSPRLLEEYQEQIKKTFFPSASSFVADSGKVLKLIEEFLMICPNLKEQALLLAYALDCEMEILSYGYLSSHFATSIETTLDKLVEVLNEIHDPAMVQSMNERLTSYRNNSKQAGWDLENRVCSILAKLDGTLN